MSRRQLELCAARMRPEEAAAFAALMAASAELFHESVKLRKQAWQLYKAAMAREGGGHG